MILKHQLAIGAWAASLSIPFALSACSFRQMDYYSLNTCINGGVCPGGVYTLSLNKCLEFAFATALIQGLCAFLALSMKIIHKSYFYTSVPILKITSVFSCGLATGAILSNGFLRNATKHKTLMALSILDGVCAYFFIFLT